MARIPGRVALFLALLIPLSIYLIAYRDVVVGAFAPPNTDDDPPPKYVEVTPAPVVRTPRIDKIVISHADANTTAYWDDDDHKLRIVTLMYETTTIDDLQWLRRLAGSIHEFESEHTRITVFGYKVPEDYYLEIRTFALLRWITIPEDHAGSAQAAREYTMETSKRLYEKFVYIHLDSFTMVHAPGLSKKVDELEHKGIIHFLYADNKVSDVVTGFIRADEKSNNTIKTGENRIQFRDYLEHANPADIHEDHGRCALLRNITSPFRIKFISAHDNDNFIKKEDRHSPDDILVCLAIAAYSGSTPVEVNEFSLVHDVLPTFLDSIRGDDTPASRYRFAMYLGLQRDPFFDDPTKMATLNFTIIEAAKEKAFSLRIFWTPLNAPTLDITYKWNVLIDQAYRDGCEYIYQYSDDTRFITPWADKFIRYLEAESNFGIVGATDANNPGIMTLSFSHRNHVGILGSYWPTHLKNWFSDDWAQAVYGPRYTMHSREVIMQNTQKQGQRYNPCEHAALFRQLLEHESRPKIIEWLKKQPPTYDIRKKLEYFEVQHATGDKKK